jgi:hypothetical protein
MLKSLSMLGKASVLPMNTSVSVAAYWRAIVDIQGCDQAISQIAGGIGAMFFVYVILVELLDFSTSTISPFTLSIAPSGGRLDVPIAYFP